MPELDIDSLSLHSLSSRSSYPSSSEASHNSLSPQPNVNIIGVFHPYEYPLHYLTSHVREAVEEANLGPRGKLGSAGFFEQVENHIWDNLVGHPTEEEEKAYRELNFPGQWNTKEGFMQNIRVLEQHEIIAADHRIVLAGSPEVKDGDRSGLTFSIAVLFDGVAIPPSRSLRDIEAATADATGTNQATNDLLLEHIAFSFLGLEEQYTHSVDQIRYPEIRRQVQSNLSLLAHQIAIRDYSLAATIDHESLVLWYAGSDGVVSSEKKYLDYHQPQIVYLIKRLTEFTEKDFGVRLRLPFASASVDFILDDSSYETFLAPINPSSVSENTSNSSSPGGGLDTLAPALTPSPPSATILEITGASVRNDRIVGSRTKGYYAKYRFKEVEGTQTTLHGFVKVTYQAIPQLHLEANVLVALRKNPHPNLVVPYGSWEAKEGVFSLPHWRDHFFTVHFFEKLEVMWALNSERYSERGFKEVICGIVEAIGHLYSLGICHRDISPENIFFRRLSNRHVVGVLGDFDHAGQNSNVRWRNDDRSLHGTLPFLSLRLLAPGTTIQDENDDFESLFYSAIWFCLRSRYWAVPTDEETSTIISAWSEGGLAARLFKLALKAEGLQSLSVTEGFIGWGGSIRPFLTKLWDYTFDPHGRSSYSEVAQQLARL